MKPRIFILGAHGRLGAAAVRLWSKQFPEHSIIPLSRSDIDFSDPEKCFLQMKKHHLKADDVILNAAAWTHVDQCQQNLPRAYAINATTPAFLASLALQHGTRFLHISTDYVLAGNQQQLSTEEEPPSPLNYYGKSKLAGETLILEQGNTETTLPAPPVVARVSWLFGPDRKCFLDQIITQALEQEEVTAIANKYSSPTYTQDLVEWLSFFLEPEAPGGLFHLCNSGSCSWWEYGNYALKVAQKKGLPLKTTSLKPIQLEEMSSFTVKRPQYTSLSTEKFTRISGITPRAWQEAVEEYINSYY